MDTTRYGIIALYCMVFKGIYGIEKKGGVLRSVLKCPIVLALEWYQTYLTEYSQWLFKLARRSPMLSENHREISEPLRGFFREET